MALSWWGKGLWQICMHQWTVHAKVEFPRFPPDVRTGGVHSTTFDPELRNESFALISFMEFPAILSALQLFQICIFNRKNSKLTFSNGSQLMGKRFMANLHASMDSTCKSRISKISTRCPELGLHSTTFDPELRNESFALISFMGFPTILSTLQPCQIRIFNRKNSKLTFSNGSQLMGKGLWQICMHHWTVHAKVEFPKFPPDVRTWGCPFHNFWSWTQKWISQFFQSGGSLSTDPHMPYWLYKLCSARLHATNYKFYLVFLKLIGT